MAEGSSTVVVAISVTVTVSIIGTIDTGVLLCGPKGDSVTVTVTGAGG